MIPGKAPRRRTTSAREASRSEVGQVPVGSRLTTPLHTSPAIRSRPPPRHAYFWTSALRAPLLDCLGPPRELQLPYGRPHAIAYGGLPPARTRTAARSEDDDPCRGRTDHGAAVQDPASDRGQRFAQSPA